MIQTMVDCHAISHNSLRAELWLHSSPTTTYSTSFFGYTSQRHQVVRCYVRVICPRRYHEGCMHIPGHGAVGFVEHSVDDVRDKLLV